MCAYRIVIASEAWPKIFCKAGTDPPRIMNQLAKWWRQSWNRNGAAAMLLEAAGDDLPVGLRKDLDVILRHARRTRVPLRILIRSR